jgi:hypothetical protein
MSDSRKLLILIIFLLLVIFLEISFVNFIRILCLYFSIWVIVNAYKTNN